MAITFVCETCGKSLSTSDDKAGRKAKCPGCGEMLTVPSAETADEEMLPESEPAAGATKACPMCGETVSATADKCEYCGEALAGGVSRRPRIIEFSDVFSTAWERFKERMGLAIVGYLIIGILSTLALLPMLVVFFAVMIVAEQNQRDPDPVQFLWLIPAGLFAMTIVTFFSVGMTRFYLQLARGEEASLGALFSGGRYFFKALVCTVLFGLMVGLGMLALIIPGVILALRYWPYLYVIVDEDPPGLECFHRSAELTTGNWGSVLLLGVVGGLINFAAQFICGLLQLFTQPLNSLLFATAYVKMTGQVR